MPSSQPSVYYGNPFSTREDAIAYLNEYLYWSIGKFFTVLYYSGNRSNNSSDVCAIVAVGIKNASECGPMGAQDSDVWTNKFYPNGASGPEFYIIVKDSGQNEQSSTSDNIVADVNLTNTKVNINNNQYVVANQEGEEQEIPDPFKFRKLNYDKY